MLVQCGVDASCNCGAPVVPVVKRVADYDEANPNKSTRLPAEALSIGNATVHRARQQDVSPETPEPKGNLWDDQDDREEEAGGFRT
jgi:hypothetical protein